MSFLQNIISTADNLAKAAESATREMADGGFTGTIPGDDQPVVEPAPDDGKALVWDPFSIIEQLGYKDRPSSITYGTLESIVWKVPLIQSIILTRINQVSTFCVPQKDMFQPGFRVRPNEKDYKPTYADRKFMAKLEDMCLNTGVTTHSLNRDRLKTFSKKFVRDSLTVDQACFEVIKNRKGQPAKFDAVDSKTIRLADTHNATYSEDPDIIRTVQIYDNMVINEWKGDEMAFCVRNPHSSIRLYGYGVSESEMLINAVTAILWAFEYNQKFFSQGSVAKGLLNIKGAMNQTQLKAFRRQWYQMISGVENAWRSPVLNSDGDVQWVSMHTSNRDMEFSMWMDFLIKLIAGVFQMDPMELGFKYGNSGGKGKEMFESATMAKLTASRDKGLKPLLEFFGECLTDYIIKPIDKDFCFEFIGLDRHSKDDLAKLNQQRVKTTHTVNELRAEQDLEPIDGGDILLDPTFVQNLNMQQQMAMGEGFEQNDYDNNDDGDGDDVNQDGKKDPNAMAMDFSEEDFAMAAEEVKKSMTAPRQVRMTVEV